MNVPEPARTSPMNPPARELLPRSIVPETLHCSKVTEPVVTSPKNAPAMEVFTLTVSSSPVLGLGRVTSVETKAVASQSSNMTLPTA